MNKTYKIEGMHCSACAASVEKILKRQPAVEDASVNLVMEDNTAPNASPQSNHYHRRRAFSSSSKQFP